MTSENMFYCRTGTALGLTCLTVIFLLITDITIAVTYPDYLSDSDSGCSLKSAFSLYCMATALQIVIAIIDLILLVNCCGSVKILTYCECKHLKIIVHFFTGAGILTATLIYGLKHPGKISFFFWLAVIGGFLAICNALLWLLTQQTKRYLTRAGVNVKHLEDGKMADGNEREE